MNRAVMMLLLFPLALVALSKAEAEESVVFSEREQVIIQSLSGEKLVNKVDPTNRASGSPEAIEMGKALFFDFRLSRDGTHACASCHNPVDNWSSAYMPGVDNTALEKHTPHLWNVAQNRWFFWDGRADTLWGQALGPIEHEGEMAGSRTALAQLIQNDSEYRRTYEALFGDIPDELLQDLPEQAKPLAELSDHPANIAWENLAGETQQAIDQVFALYTTKRVSS